MPLTNCASVQLLVDLAAYEQVNSYLRAYPGLLQLTDVRIETGGELSVGRWARLNQKD